MPYRRERHILFELTGIQEDDLQERGERIISKLIGIAQDALQERGKHRY